MSKFQRVRRPGHPDYRFTVYSSRVQWVTLAVLMSVLILIFSSIVLLGLYSAFAEEGGTALLLVLAMAALLVVLCCVGLIYGVTRFVTGKTVLILDNTGIHDNGSIAGFGFISWDNIHDLGIRTFGPRMQRMLSIYPTNPEAVLNQASGLKGKALRANITLIGTPIGLVADLMAIPLEQLEAEIRRNLDVRRRSRR